MIEITTATSKRELLEILANNAEEEGDLVINIISLPTFLTTPIAFTIFNYQISNYPRKVLWNSQNTLILKFLYTCQVDIPKQEEVKTEPEYEEVIYNAEPEEKPSYQKPKPTIIEFKPVLENVKSETVEEVFALTSIAETLNPEIPNNKPKKVNHASIRAEELLSNVGYQRSTLLEDLLEDEVPTTEEKKIAAKKPEFEFVNKVKISSIIEPESVSSVDFDNQQHNLESKDLFVETPEQDLDNWLDRIEATRQALSSIRSIDNYKPKKRGVVFKFFQFTGISVALSSLIIAFLVLFPTNVYSLDVVNNQETASTTLNLSKNQFLKQTKTVSSTAQSPASGQETIKLGKARGKVALINKSGGDVRFDRSGIIMVSGGGNEYRHVPVAGEPGTFTVPARSNVNGTNVVINVEAASLGDNFNLAKDQSLKIYNLKRDLIGGLFQAVVIEDIKTEQNTGNAVVQPADLTKAQTDAAQDLGVKAKDELLKLKNSGNLTEDSWYEIKSVNNNFSQKAGDVAANVLVETTANVDLYYLNSTILDQELKIKNDQIKSVKSITSIKAEGSVIKDDVVTVNVDYIYSTQFELKKDEIVEKLNQGDVDQAIKELKQSYPEIKEIKKEEEGLRLPGVPARVNISINEKEQ